MTVTALLHWTGAAGPRPLTSPAIAAKAEQEQVTQPAISKAEAEHNAAFDAAIAPLTAHVVSKDDAARIKDAIDTLRSQEPEKAALLRADISDPVGGKLIDWYRLTRGYGMAGDYAAFIDNSENWPQTSLLVQRLEEALFIEGGKADAIKARFQRKPPETGIGMAALASAHLALGDTAEATSLAARTWREADIPASLEDGFLKRFGSLLKPDDHKWRLDRLLIADFRWKSDRNNRAKAIRRLIPLLPPAEQKKAKARLAVFLRSSSGRKLVEALPAQEDPDWGVVFHRVQALRRAKKFDDAAKLLLGAPTERAKVVNPDGWWEERRANAYEALDAGKAKLAYELVREPGPVGVNALNDQRFLAGWIAFSHLKDAKSAEAHFRAMTQSADGPKTRSKANYWLGRTLAALGDQTAAKRAYEEAGEDSDAFHAMLARQELDPAPRTIKVTPPERPTDKEVQNFNALEPAKALVIANKAGLPRDIVRLLIVNLRNIVSSEAELAMVAHLAEAIGDTQMAVRTAKSAIAQRKNLIYYGYPIHPFPDYKPLRDPPETAFLLGITRQETEFNTSIVSGAGAKGLMQVMTVTAKHVCRDYKIKCDIKRLLKDPAYNAMIGSAYIGDRMREFSGSYVLALAGYNAGPGRARQWIREFGDPRDPAVDPVDWIERIPFEETRQYVGKVLANIQMYRARLGDQPALRLAQDLARGRRSPSGEKQTGDTRSKSAKRTPDR